MPSARKILVSAAVAGAVVAGGTFAYAATAQADDTQPSSLVEDYSYPGAAAVQAAHQIKLISGDGHIMLATCDPAATDLITVESYNNINEPQYCFKVTGTTGYLSLEIPKVFFIWTGDDKVTATVTVSGVEQAPLVIPANDGSPVGSGDTQNHAVLLELMV
jgi:hypothetical protein